MRNYIRKTNRASIPKNTVIEAVKQVVEHDNSYNVISRSYNIPKRSLIRYCRQYRDKIGTSGASSSTETIDINVGYGERKQNYVFNTEEEAKLEQYILKCSRINFGLSPKEIRKLAYQYAVAIKAKMPENWTKNLIAGQDWFSKFMKRHSTLSLRTPEATSLARASSFNRNNVELFFNNFKDIMTRFQAQSYNIWNMDETGVVTVQKPNRVVAKRGGKQIGYTTSAERGQLVTLVCTVSATGSYIPPFFVFPRVHFKDYFIRDGPVGSAGGANPSGWINEDLFLLYLMHFVKHVKCNQSNRVLLLLDNHESHLSIKAIDFAKQNGIIMLTFPPHCSHKMQPLDISVYGPLKKYINAAMDSWMLSYPGTTISIYHIPAIIKDVLPTALTPSNIMAGFKVN
jgi:transposase-like protein